MSEPFLIDSAADLVESVGEVAIKRQQFIPTEFMDDIRRQREDSLSAPCGDWVHAARIPVYVIDKWHREGFDYNRAPVADILKKLAKEQLDEFIATKKRL